MAKDPAFLLFDEPEFDISVFGPPRSEGVYVICIVSNSILIPVYIGSSSNILKRVMSPDHVYRRLVNLLKTVVGCYFLECENYRDVEVELIRKYRPRFNIQHNG